MAKFLSSTDLAIALAAKRGTLRLVERPSRFGDTFVLQRTGVGQPILPLAARRSLKSPTSASCKKSQCRHGAVY